MTIPEVEIRSEGHFTHSVYVNGQRLVDRESSYQVASNIAHFLRNPDAWERSESCQVADSIRRWLVESGRSSA